MTLKNSYIKNISLALAVTSALFLIISGTTGAVSWIKTKNLILNYISSPILELPFIALTAIASFGGLSVLLGGILIYRENFFGGRLLIGLGSGAGIISLTTNIIAAVSVNARIGPFDSFLSLSSLGIIFALASQISSLKINKSNDT